MILLFSKTIRSWCTRCTFQEYCSFGWNQCSIEFEEIFFFSIITIIFAHRICQRIAEGSKDDSVSIGHFVFSVNERLQINYCPGSRPISWCIIHWIMSGHRLKSNDATSYVRRIEMPGHRGLGMQSFVLDCEIWCRYGNSPFDLRSNFPPFIDHNKWYDLRWKCNQMGTKWVGIRIFKFIWMRCSPHVFHINIVILRTVAISFSPFILSLLIFALHSPLIRTNTISNTNNAQIQQTENKMRMRGEWNLG